MLELARGGWSCIDIGRALGVTRQAISAALKRHAQARPRMRQEHAGANLEATPPPDGQVRCERCWLILPHENCIARTVVGHLDRMVSP